MNHKINLPKALKNRLFTSNEAKGYGISQYHLNLMLSDGSLERLGRGVYRTNTGDISNEEMFVMATIWLGYPSAVCLLSSLSYFNLTDEIPKRVWMMVDHTKMSHRHELRLVRLRQPHWDIGIKKTKRFWMSGVARTIVDIFMHPQIVSTTMAVQALKQAIKEKQTSVREIYDMSLALGINERILPYLEMLS
jgi:predicted transcriptional regulator of viral defense system